MVLLGIFLTTNGAEYLFMCLFAIYISSFEKFFIHSLCSFLIRVFVFLLWNYKSSLSLSLYIYRFKSLIKYMICKYFLLFCRFSFDFLLKHKMFNFYEVQFIIYVFLSFVTCAFSVLSKKILTNFRPQGFTPIFSSKSFVFSSFI